MNDLEPIRSLYAGVPDEAATDRAARAALGALRARIDAPSPRRLRPRLALALGGTAAALAAGAVLLAGSDTTTESAAAYLNQAARSAAQSDERWRLGPGDYWYVASKIVNTGAAERCDRPVKQETPDGGFLVRGDCGTITNEEWEAIDDSGRLRRTGPTGPDGVPFKSDHRMDPHPQGADRPYIDLAGLDISYAQLAEMPGDQLAERVREHAERWAREPDAPTVTNNLFLFVGNLLAEEALSPDQRAALYRVIAAQPGVRLLGEVTDPEGRRGVAVGYGEAGREAMIVFDPDTSKVLAAGTGLAGRTPPAGSGQYIVFLRSGVVGSTSETG